MAKGSDGKAMPGGLRTRGWKEKRTAYMCTDETDVLVPNRALERTVRDYNGPDGEDIQTQLANGIVYRTGTKTN